MAESTRGASELLEIVVRGNARGSYPPERALLSLSVDFSGPDRETVYTDAAEVQARIAESLTDLDERGAVSKWHSESVHVWSYRPVDPKGKPRELLYVTQIRVRTEFVDFDELGTFIDTWATVEGVDVGGVRWDVTDEGRLEHERDLRRQAVDDAVAKAQAYADAVGRGPVRAIQLADPDMLSNSAEPMSRMMVTGAPAAGGAAPTLELRAEDIHIAVSVDARFVAG